MAGFDQACRSQPTLPACLGREVLAGSMQLSRSYPTLPACLGRGVLTGLKRVSCSPTTLPTLSGGEVPTGLAALTRPPPTCPVCYSLQLCPKESTSFIDETGSFNMKVQYMRAHIADDGTIHIAADRATMKQQLASVDLDRARTLTKTSYFWVRGEKQRNW